MHPDQDEVYRVSKLISLHTGLTSTFAAWLPVPWWRARAAQRSETTSVFEFYAAKRDERPCSLAVWGLPGDAAVQ